jgi:hypothetical protein
MPAIQKDEPNLDRRGPRQARNPTDAIFPTPLVTHNRLRLKNSFYRNLLQVSIENKDTNPGFFSRFNRSGW